MQQKDERRAKNERLGPPPEPSPSVQPHIHRSQRVRVVYLSASGQLGGAERCLLDVLQSVRLAEPAWNLSVVAPRPGMLVERVRALGFTAEVIPMPEGLAALGDSGVQGGAQRMVGVGIRTVATLGGVAAYRRRMRTTLRRLGPDIVHTNGYKMHIMGAWSRPASAGLVWHLHDYASSRPLMAHAIARLSRNCDAGIAVSASVADDVAELWRGPSPVQVVWNAVDLDVFRPDGDRADLDALAGLPAAPPGVVRIGLVATMGRFKGHDVFLRAIAALPSSLPVRAYVLGGSLYETRHSQVSIEALQELAAELGISDRVGFTGFVEEPASAMRSLDVVVHATTVPEPFGLVIAEGMACGRAVIASEAGGAGQIVSAGVDALVHEPGDVEGLSGAIRRLVDDETLRHRLGKAARTSAEVRFDRARIGREIGPIYQAARARHRAAGSNA